MRYVSIKTGNLEQNPPFPPAIYRMKRIRSVNCEIACDIDAVDAANPTFSRSQSFGDRPKKVLMYYIYIS